MTQWKTGSFSGSPYVRGDYRAPAQRAGDNTIRHGSAGSQAYIGRQNNLINADFNPLGAQWDWDAPQFWQDNGGLRTDTVTAITIAIQVIAATLTYAGQTVTVNAKTFAAVTAATLIYAGQVITVKTVIGVIAATIVFTGQAATANAKRFVTVTAATLAYAGQAIVARTSITAAAATIAYAGQAISTTVQAVASRGAQALRLGLRIGL